MKRITLLLLIIAAQLAFAGDRDTTIARESLLISIKDNHAELSKRFQYSLSPEQLALQDKMKEAVTQYQTFSALKMDSVRVGK